MAQDDDDYSLSPALAAQAQPATPVPPKKDAPAPSAPTDPDHDYSLSPALAAHTTPSIYTPPKTDDTARPGIWDYIKGVTERGFAAAGNNMAAGGNAELGTLPGAAPPTAAPVASGGLTVPTLGQANTELFGKPNVVAPSTTAKYIGAVGEGLASNPLLAVAAPTSIPSIATSALGSQAASDLFPNSKLAPVVGGLIGAGVPSALSSGYNALTRPPVINTEGLAPNPSVPMTVQTPGMMPDAPKSVIATEAALRADPRTAPVFSNIDAENQAMMKARMEAINHPTLEGPARNAMRPYDPALPADQAGVLGPDGNIDPDKFHKFVTGLKNDGSISDQPGFATDRSSQPHLDDLDNRSWEFYADHPTTPAGPTTTRPIAVPSDHPEVKALNQMDDMLQGKAKLDTTTPRDISKLGVNSLRSFLASEPTLMDLFAPQLLTAPGTAIGHLLGSPEVGGIFGSATGSTISAAEMAAKKLFGPRYAAGNATRNDAAVRNLLQGYTVPPTYSLDPKLQPQGAVRNMLTTMPAQPGVATASGALPDPGPPSSVPWRAGNVLGLPWFQSK